MKTRGSLTALVCALTACAGLPAVATAQSPVQTAYGEEQGVLHRLGAPAPVPNAAAAVPGAPEDSAPAASGDRGERAPQRAAPPRAPEAPAAPATPAQPERTVVATRSGSGLPFTGLEVAVLVAMGLVLVGTGLALRRAGAGHRPAEL